ncbi:MAG TPA: hypothetical protein VGP31_18510, partial [Planosporangium sp.]|nr:hypothetical protein [Planosporangium sp.]
MQALGAIADTLAEITLVAGAMVGVVRNTVRDLIAEVVGAAVSKAVQALLVVTIPKIVAEVGLMVAECSAKILSLLKKLLAAIEKITGGIKIAKSLLDRIGASLTKASHNVTILDSYRIEVTGTATSGSDGL